MVGHTGHLRKMCDGEHLAGGRQLVQLVGDRLRCASADPRIDFVEDQHRDVFMSGKNALHRQHDPGQLAAGGDFAERAQRFARIGRDHELGVVDSLSREANAPAIHLYAPRIL
ncbi:hypothetical protein D3C72_1963270 [compost metagenome]